MKLECIYIYLPHIFHTCQFIQILFQGRQLKVTFARVVRQNWNAIIDLIGVGVGCIVNQHHLTQGTVYYAEVFDVGPICHQIARLPKYAMVDVLMLGVQVVQNGIGIARLAGGKHHDLEIGRQVLQQLHSPRSDIDASINNLPISQHHRQADMALGLVIFVEVDQSFVQIKNYCFFV